METKVDSKVILYNADNKRLGETFSRRARQLVKQQRAEWTDESHTAVRFFPDVPEEWEGPEIATFAPEPAPHPRPEGRTTHPRPEERAPRKPSAIFALAQKRLRTRRLMFWHSLLLLPGYAFVGVISGAFWPNSFSEGFMLGVGLTLWTISYIYTVVQYVRHNRGFFPMAAFESRQARRLAAEVEQLKRMGYSE